jgi:branched-chain amino acid transport system permease protein
MPRAVSIALLIGAVILAFLPFFADRFVLQLMTRVLTMTIFALSLGFLVSGGGLVSLGHAAYFGVAAYVLALASPAMEPANLLWALPLVLAVTAATAAIIGFLVVRTKGVYFIMVTLAFGQMLFHLFHDTKIAGGSDGMFLDARPVLDIFGMQLLDLQDRPTL